MLGSLASMMGYLIVLFVLSIWMTVRIWRRSPVLAILSFLFWPVSIVALIMTWGDEESDIRVPFFLSVLVAGLAGYMAVRAVEKGVQEFSHEIAYALSDEDIAEIRASDPELARQLETARAEQRAMMVASGEWEEGDWDEVESADGGGEERSATGLAIVEQSPEAAAAARAPRDPAVLDAEHRATLDRAAGHIAWQFGRVALPGTDLTLELPRNVRFAARSTLHHVARLRHVPMPADVLGWAVYRDVSLAREDAWYVQVRRVPLAGPLAPPDVLAEPTAKAMEELAWAGRVAGALGIDPKTISATTWDAANGIVTFARAEGGSADAPSTYSDAYAVRVQRDMLIEFRAPMLHAAHTELGTRATRLLAQRTKAPAATAAGATAAAAR